jgi:hypothetical protein
MADIRTTEQFMRHMQKRLTKTFVVQTPPIPLYWNSIIGADLVVGRHWFACAGKITKVFVSLTGEVKKETPAVIRFEFKSKTTGHFIETTAKEKELSAVVDIDVAEGEHLVVSVNSEQYVAAEIAALFTPASNVLDSAKVFYSEVERLCNEGNGDTSEGVLESGTSSGEQKQAKHSWPVQLPESTSD